MRRPNFRRANEQTEDLKSDIPAEEPNDEEEAGTEEGGALPVTLGPLILRAETAAIYGLANLGCARNNTDFSE